MSEPVADVSGVLAAMAAIEKQDILDPLWSLVGGSVGIAYPNPPNTVSQADLMAFVNLPGPLLAQENETGSDNSVIVTEVREYSAMFLKSVYGGGVPGEAFGDLTPYFPLVRNVFVGHRSLGRLKGVQDSAYLGDGGAQILEYAGLEFNGFRARIRVTSKVQVPYALYE